MQSWLEGRNREGKGTQATEMTTSLRILSVKADSNTWERFTRSELKLNQESPRSDIFRKRATKPLLNQKHRQKRLTWTKEKNNWTVAQCSKVPLFRWTLMLHFICKSMSQSLEEERRDTESMFLKSSVKFPQSVMIWACRDVCWCWSAVFYEVHSQRSHLSGNVRNTSCFLLLTNFMEMLVSFSSRTLAPAHRVKNTSKWFADHDITVFDWPANMPDLNPRNIPGWGILKRKMRNSRSEIVSQ